jgi:3-oxoadipate enol-lactonase
MRFGPVSPLPVVLLHGFPLDQTVWSDLIAALPDRHLVTLDLPGFGRSADVGAATMADFADAVRRSLAEHGLLPCVLGGLSMGGYVALDFISRYPNDVCGLILIDTKSAADDEAGRRGRDAMIQTVHAGGTGAVADQMLPKVLGPTTHRDRPGVVAFVRRMIVSQPPAGIAAALSAMRDRPDYTPALGKIAVPTLVIVGEEDGIAPVPGATAVGTAVAGSTLAVIKGSGHLSPVETPKAVADALARWGSSPAPVQQTATPPVPSLHP